MEYNDFIRQIATHPCPKTTPADAATILRRMQFRKRNLRLTLSLMLLLAIGGLTFVLRLPTPHQDYALWQQVRPSISNPSQQQFDAYIRSQQRRANQNSLVRNFQEKR